MLTLEDVQQLSYGDLLSALEGVVGATNEWDIVCSYSIDALNAVLSSAHQSNKIVTSIQLSVTHKDIAPPHSLYVTNYNLNIGAPSLEFAPGSGGSAILTMPILSSSNLQITDSQGALLETDNIPAGYSLVANVPLASITGNNTVTSGSGVIVLDPSNTTNIVLHFSSALTNFSISPTPDQSTSVGNALCNSDLFAGITEYFRTKVNDIDYCLAQLSASANNPSGITIRPSSFVFATQQNILSLFVQTTNSGNGPGNPNPAFQPNGREVLPVPQGMTASLLFSRQFIEKVYLEPLLQQGQSYSITSRTNGIGISYNCKAPNVSYDMSTGNQVSGDFNIDTLSMDFSSPPLAYQIWLDGQAGNISWNFNQNLNWNGDESMPDGSGGWSKYHKQGSCDVSISLNKNISLSNIDSNTFTIDCSMQASDYNVNFSTNGDTDFWGPVNGNTNDIKAAAVAALPSINLNFGGLNFFAAANLLFPDSQKFTINTILGIAIPGDLLLVGNIN